VRGSELITFAGAGHTIPVEEPGPLTAVIDDFLARRVGPPDATRRSGRARS
jgi:pimeloyl-ACP methyl ester carboxylesterase